MKALTLPSVSHSQQQHRIGSLLSSRFVMNLEPEHLLQLIKDLSELLNNQQKENLLEHLTTHMKLGHLESLRLTSRLHSTCVSFNDCFDFVSWLPPELVTRIFSYLPWDALISCSLVNRAWLKAARNPELYRRLCQLPEWCPPVLDRLSAIDVSTDPAMVAPNCGMRTSAPGSEKQSMPSLSPVFTIGQKTASIDWFTVFKKRSRLRRNWLLGKHRIRRFSGHSEAVYCVACDAHRIVSGSADATIRVWNVRTNATWSVQTLRGHSDAVRCVQLLSLTAPLASTASATGSPCHDLGSPMTPPPDSPRFDARQPPEALLISGSTDTTIKLWHLSSTSNWSRIACISTLQGHTDTVRCLQADHEKVISGSYDCTVRLWNLNTNQLQHVFRGHSAGVVCLVYDDRFLFSGSLDNTVRVWCLNSGICLYVLYRSVPCMDTQQFWLTPVSSLHLDPLRNRLLIAHHDGVILTWSLPAALCTSNGGVGGSDAAARLAPMDPISVHLTERFGPTDFTTGTVLRCIVGDAWHIVCGSDNKTLKVWRTDNDQLINVLHGHEDGITCAVVTPSRVVSGSYDKSIILYDFDIA